MPEVSWAEIRRIAARLGHTNLTVLRMRDGFYRCECSCGYRSTRAALESESVKQAVYHFELVASGAWDRPKFPGSPSRAEMVREQRESDRRAAEGRRRAAAGADDARDAVSDDTPTHAPEGMAVPR